jgi:hypothetical protein
VRPISAGVNASPLWKRQYLSVASSQKLKTIPHALTASLTSSESIPHQKRKYSLVNKHLASATNRAKHEARTATYLGLMVAPNPE